MRSVLTILSPCFLKRLESAVSSTHFSKIVLSSCSKTGGRVLIHFQNQMWALIKKTSSHWYSALTCSCTCFQTCTAALRERQQSSTAYLLPTVTDREQTLWEKHVYCSLSRLPPKPPPSLPSLACVQKAQRGELKRKKKRKKKEKKNTTPQALLILCRSLILLSYAS